MAGNFTKGIVCTLSKAVILFVGIDSRKYSEMCLQIYIYVQIYIYIYIFHYSIIYIFWGKMAVK